MGTAARKDVKVGENWLDDPERDRAMGLEFPKG